jgi:hypothetical protein
MEMMNLERISSLFSLNKTNRRYFELLAVSLISSFLCLTYKSLTCKKDEDEVGPIVYEDFIISEPDPLLWEGIKQACLEAIANEPILDKTFHREVLRHPNLESCLAELLSIKLGCQSVPVEELKSIFDQVLLKKAKGEPSKDFPDAFQWPPKEGKWDLATLIRSDLWTIKERCVSTDTLFHLLCKNLQTSTEHIIEILHA